MRMLIEIETNDGPRKVRVCGYCKSTCIPRGEFCSSRCYHNHLDALIRKQREDRDSQLKAIKEWDEKRKAQADGH